MLRPSASQRRVLGLALAVSVGTGVGLGAPSLLSASRADVPQVPLSQAVATTANSANSANSATTETAPAEAPAPSPLTLEEAKAVAAQVAPGRVIEWDQDNEPTGLRFDVKLLHDDGSTTEVEVDTITGQVTSVNHDNDLD